MTPRPDASSHGLLRFAWVAALVFALSFIAWDTNGRVRNIRQVTGVYGVTVDAPSLDPRSATGYALGKRSVILPDRDMDGYHWIMQAQAMVASGDVRVRHVDYDGAPTGRDVHWAIPFRAWIVFLAWIERAWTDEPWGIALENAAVISGPVLLIVALLAITPLLARRFSPSAAALFAIGAVAPRPFYVDFVAGYADHHGLVNLCAMLGVLCFAAASRNNVHARRWMIASGVTGGVGLWISTATEAPVLVGMGAGAMLACWLGRGASWTERPVLLRWWAAAGAAVSVVAYLAEYFPSHLRLRLEANHPLYALMWLAGGEILVRIARLRSGTSPTSRRRDLMELTLACAAAAILPIVLLLTKTSTFLVADSFLWRLHHDFIAEFQSLNGFLSRHSYNSDALAPCLPLLLLVMVLVAALRRRAQPEVCAALVAAVVPALCVLPLMWNQIRWWGLEIALIIPPAAVLFAILERESLAGQRSLRIATICAVLLFVPGMSLAVQQAQRNDETSEEDIRSLVERDLAHWLRQRAGNDRVVVAASPTVATTLIYHGGISGVGTLYWENIAGLKASAALYSAPTERAARDIVERCGITHIVIVSWEGFEGAYVRLARGLASSDPIPSDAFIVQLLQSEMPPAWLRPLPFPLPTHPALEGQQVRIFEVTPEQSRVAAEIHTASYLLETDQARLAQQMIPALTEYDRDIPAIAMVAEITARNQDSDGFQRAVSRLVENRPSPPALPAEDHIRVIAALATAGRFEPARTELEQCFRDLREPELRRLPVASLVGLLALSKAAKIDWPDPKLHELAITLVPPGRRK